ncbi:MAG: peptidylprolyl isomerase [Nanoarchaeota archaeon]|nr:peptidylprolyl isomerase [Nanoarchaeota archaeon]
MENQESSEPKKKVRVRTGRIISIIIVIAIVFLAFFLFKNYQQSPTGAVAATVNGEKISMQELNAQYDAIPEIYKSFVTKSSLLEQLITEKLLIQDSKSKGIEVSDTEIDDNIDKLRKSTGQSVEEFQISLEQQGLSLQDLRVQYTNQIMIAKLLNQTLFQELLVSDSEAENYYQENIEQFLAEASQIHARHILVETKSEGEDLIEMLDSGKDFIALAKEYSTGPTGVKGGDLGFFKKEEMVEEFANAAFELNVGEYSKEPVKTQFGYHVIKVEPRKIVFEDAKDSIKEALIKQKQQTAMQIYIKQLRNSANVDVVVEEESLDDPSLASPEIVETGTKTECFTEFGLTKDTVILYYLDSNKCPQCQNMFASVKSLEGKGYNFYYADIADKGSLDVLDACFSDLVEGKAPLFICAGSGEYVLGEMKESSLVKFAQECS